MNGKVKAIPMLSERWKIGQGKDKKTKQKAKRKGKAAITNDGPAKEENKETKEKVLKVPSAMSNLATGAGHVADSRGAGGRLSGLQVSEPVNSCKW